MMTVKELCAKLAELPDDEFVTVQVGGDKFDIDSVAQDYEQETNHEDGDYQMCRDGVVMSCSMNTKENCREIKIS